MNTGHLESFTGLVQLIILILILILILTTMTTVPNTPHCNLIVRVETNTRWI